MRLLIDRCVRGDLQLSAFVLAFDVERTGVVVVLLVVVLTTVGIDFVHPHLQTVCGKVSYS